MEASHQQQLVHDLSGFDYVLRKSFGQGGQGKVWTTNIPGVAIKTLMKDESLEREHDAIQLYQAKMQRLKQLPLHGLNQFSLPIAILQDACGYVMRYMNGTSTLLNLMPNRFTSKLIQESDIHLPFWLQSQMDALRQSDAELAAALEDTLRRLALYAQTGGVRLRWLLVYEIAEILSLLHARGLVFGDLSVGNILVSTRRYSVWFIDVDNICLQGEGSVVFTPSCCAPEVFKQTKGVTQQSDVYAFALLAFELLTMRHPFQSGRLVEEAGALIVQQEEAANSGNLPWILDSTDRSNALTQEDELLQYTLTHDVLALFQQTFGVGKNESSVRPPLWMFKQAIKQARYRSIVCPHCMMGFTYGENTIENGVCPFCGSKLPLVLVMSFKRQVLWAHELAAPNLAQDSPYQHFEFLNRLVIPLELLNPVAAHKSQSLPQTDILFDEEQKFADFTNSGTTQQSNAAKQGNSVQQGSTAMYGNTSQQDSAAMQGNGAQHSNTAMHGNKGGRPAQTAESKVAEAVTSQALSAQTPKKANQAQPHKSTNQVQASKSASQAKNSTAVLHNVASQATNAQNLLAGSEDSTILGNAYSNESDQWAHNGDLQNTAPCLTKQSTGFALLKTVRLNDVLQDQAWEDDYADLFTESALSLDDELSMEDELGMGNTAWMGKSLNAQQGRSRQVAALHNQYGKTNSFMDILDEDTEEDLAQTSDKNASNTAAKSVNHAVNHVAQPAHSTDHKHTTAEPTSNQPQSNQASQLLHQSQPLQQLHQTQSSQAQCALHSKDSTQQAAHTHSKDGSTLHHSATSAELFNKSGFKHRLLDISVASMTWHQNTLFIYPEEEFEQVLEYALVPPEVALKQNTQKIKPQYAVCPQGLEISVQQLSYGICLRLSGGRQVLLRCEAL